MRRIHVPVLKAGTIPLSESQAHHLRDVLRLASGQVVQAFDDAGNTAQAQIVEISPRGVSVRIETIDGPAGNFHLAVASAVPKAARADWMIEKLSELGVWRFIPLASERSVVLPRGPAKIQRWRRLAAESAKQSRRPGVMEIQPLTPLPDLLAARPVGQPWWHLSTDAAAPPLTQRLRNLGPSLTLLIGPEGGWSRQELAWFIRLDIPPAHMTDTILRIETAAIAAAAIVATAAAASAWGQMTAET